MKSSSFLTERDLKALRVFRVTAQAGGFAAAEEELCMSRSTISRYISDVEKTLGARLCERGPKGFQLSQAGEAALRATADALDALNRIGADVQSALGRVSGSLSVGVADNLVLNRSCRLPQALRRVVDQAFELHVNLTAAAPAVLEHMLFERKLHLIIGPRLSDTRRLTAVELFSESLAVFRAKGPWLGAPPTTIVRRQDYPFLNSIYGPDADVYGGPVASDVEAAALMVATGTCMGVLPVKYAEQVSKRFPLERVRKYKKLDYPFYALFEARRTLPSGVDALVGALREEHASIGLVHQKLHDPFE